MKRKTTKKAVPTAERTLNIVIPKEQGRRLQAAIELARFGQKIADAMGKGDLNVTLAGSLSLHTLNVGTGSVTIGNATKSVELVHDDFEEDDE